MALRQPLSNVFLHGTTSCRFELICGLTGGYARIEIYVSIIKVRCNRMSKIICTFPSSAQLLDMSVFVSVGQCVWVLGDAHRLMTGCWKPFCPRAGGLIFNNERSLPTLYTR